MQSLQFIFVNILTLWIHFTRISKLKSSQRQILRGDERAWRNYSARRVRARVLWATEAAEAPKGAGNMCDEGGRGLNPACVCVCVLYCGCSEWQHRQGERPAGPMEQPKQEGGVRCAATCMALCPTW
jgi:hypothetical protein